MAVMVILKCDIGSKAATVLCIECGRISRQILKEGYSNNMSTFLRPHTCPVCGSTHQCCRAPIDDKWSSAFLRYNINADAYNASVKQNYAQRNFRKHDTQPAEDIKPAMESLGSVLHQISDAQKLELLTPPVPDTPAKPVDAHNEDQSPAPHTLSADTVQPKSLPTKTEPAEPVVLSDNTTIALDHKINHWKKELLDTSKRNKMINYRETKRATLRILEPGAEELFNRLAFSEKALSFQRPISKDSDFRTFAMLSLLETLNYNLPVHVGDIKADGTIVEREKTLKNLRAKTKLAQEEQGTNILYLSFGFILWREHNRDSSPWLKAPVLMMPVSLGLKSLNAPYTLSRYDDEIEVNPTLDYLFNAEYGIDLPTFELKNRNSFNDYMDTIEEIVDKRGWKLVREVNLGLLSFLKISMYHDINNNRELILNNPVLQAISGDRTALGDLPPEAVNFHFDESSPQQWHEVVDSDSSQEEAILLSKLGVSFVMQGPPGTGKSQTITNIIAEALADGKKVLFVSEKAAALQVVLKRLTEVNLSDFCLSLHNYKANKKEIIDNIGANLSLPQEYTKQSVLNELTELFYDRKYLDEYAEDLHKIIEPLGDSIYVVYGKLSKLETASVVEFSVDNPTEISREKYASILYCISAFEKALHNMEGPLSSNPWYLTSATSSGQTFKTELIAKTKDLNVTLDEIAESVSEFNTRYHASLPNTWSDIAPAIKRVNEALSLPLFPYSWSNPATLSEVQNAAAEEQHIQKAYYDGLATNHEHFDDGILDAPINNWLADISCVKSSFAKLGFEDNGTVFSDAIRNIGAVESALALLRTFSEQYDHANQLIGLSGTDTLPNAITLHKATSLLKSSPLPMQQGWFDATINDRAAKLANDASQHATILAQHHANITAKWYDTVLSIDATEIHNHFCSTSAWIYNDSQNTNIEDSLSEAVSYAKALYEKVEALISDHEQAAGLLALTPEHTLQHMTMVSSILKMVTGAPYLETPWFDMRKNANYLAVAEEAKSHTETIARLSATLLEDWEPKALSIDAEAMLARFKTEYVGLFYKLKGSYKEDLKTVRLLSKHVGKQIDEESVIKFLQTIIEINREQVWFTENATKLTEAFGSQNKGVDTDWSKLHAGIVCAFDIAHQFPYANIPFDTISAIQRIINDIQLSGTARQLSEEVSIERIGMLGNELSAVPYITEIVDATSFRDDVLAQITKFIDDCNVQQKYISQIKAASKEDSLNYDDITALLENIAVVNKEAKWFEDQKDTLSSIFGKAYNGHTTDWTKLSVGIRCAADLNSLFKNAHIPNQLIENACSSSVEASCIPDFDALSEDSIEILRDRLAVVIPHVNFDQVSITSALTSALETYLNDAKVVSEFAEQVSPFILNDISIDVIADLLVSVNNLKSKRDLLCSHADQMSNTFGSRYTGLDTNWTAVISDLQAIRDFFATEDDILSSEFLVACCNNQESRIEMSSLIKRVSDLYESAASGVKYFAALFPSSELHAMQLSTLSSKYLACLNGFGELNKWLDYVETKEECDKLGLTQFTDQIAKLDNSIKDVTAAFERGFYTQWLSLAINDVPAVQTFRRRAHEQHLEKFISLDQKQFTLSRDRIRAKIISTFPRTNQVARAGSELGILRHEMEKQRRIMPLRQLFRKIPNLLLTLKPCLMMSPLSVAYFLEAGAYQFDMVIFDEASQIFPQDAIGAIFRAKQVVIAGDTKQLPPTNFFSASTSNAAQDYDDYNDEYEDEIYDSILEETANVLPNRTLLWHYRSKHEHLIAFSNQSIYRNELVTFPSSNESEPDTGVEFVYVEDGYYEGGGRNCNVPEAKRCVALIKDHIERHPDRSLGVIAFSEKQQQAIALEVQRFREQNPQYEDFFVEGKEDEFFIKNLENVQGDERDTIFFSVGYAKTKEQKLNNRPMAMRFGPLGVSGGERRLNVAITRAKINVKLISSILPSDIDLNRTESEGIKMLRSYIDFAKNGAVSLASAHTLNRTDDFVDTISKVIEAKGYKLRKHVGCSGYKIDIAIEHPDIENQFIAGIECDGFSYASAKTARDRDRLRKSVLTNMGWNLYRIWSTEWYKNPEVEGQKLFAFIEKAISMSNERLKEIEAQKRAIEEEKARELEKARLAKEREERRRQQEAEKQLEASRRKAEEAKAARQKEKERIARERLAKEEQAKREAEKRAQEEAKRVQEEKAAQAARTHSWAVPGAKVQSKAFGIGIIKAIRGAALDVEFNGELKHFSYPNAFEQKFLVQAHDAPVKDIAKSKSNTPVNTKSGTDLFKRLKDSGFNCIDNRSTSSILWVLYSADKKIEFERIAKEYNARYTLERRGSIATKNRAAWRIMY